MLDNKVACRQCTNNHHETLDISLIATYHFSGQNYTKAKNIVLKNFWHRESNVHLIRVVLFITPATTYAKGTVFIPFRIDLHLVLLPLLLENHDPYALAVVYSDTPLDYYDFHNPNFHHDSLATHLFSFL